MSLLKAGISRVQVHGTLRIKIQLTARGWHGGIITVYFPEDPDIKFKVIKLFNMPFVRKLSRNAILEEIGGNLFWPNKIELPISVHIAQFIDKLQKRGRGGLFTRFKQLF